MIKADEVFVQDSLDKHYSICNLLFQSQKFPIGAKFISNGETLRLFTFRPSPKNVLRTRSQIVFIVLLVFVPKRLENTPKQFCFPKLQINFECRKFSKGPKLFSD